MIRRPRPWLVAAALFTLVNLVGAAYAAAQGEPLHAAAHAGLMFLGAYFVWRLARRTAQQGRPSVPLGDARLELLQQSVDAVALEVERIGEAQRFNAKLQSERTETPR